MLFKAIVTFLREARIVDDLPVKSLLELINHDGTFLYHLVKRLGVDVSPVHTRLYHRSCSRANILSNHEVMLSFIATLGVSPTLLPAPKVLYFATKESIGANLIYQLLRCVYRKRIRQGEHYLIKMANYLNALYDLRSEPVYSLSSFTRHTNLPKSLVKLSLSTSCMSLSLFVAGIHRFLEESGVPCGEFLMGFYKFPTALLQITRNYSKLRQLLSTFGVPLFFSPVTWLSIKDEEPYFDLRLIQVYLILDKLRGCLPIAASKRMKLVLFSSSAMDPALPQPLDLVWRDALSGANEVMQHKLVDFLKMDMSALESADDSEEIKIDASKSVGKIPNTNVDALTDKDTAGTGVRTTCDVIYANDSNPQKGNGSYEQFLQQEERGITALLADIPEISKSGGKGNRSPTHHRQTRIDRPQNDDPLCATHPLYSEQEHQKLMDARTFKPAQGDSIPEVEEMSTPFDESVIPTCAPVQHIANAASITAESEFANLGLIQQLEAEIAEAEQKKLERRMNAFLNNHDNLTSDGSEADDKPIEDQPDGELDQSSARSFNKLQASASPKSRDSLSPHSPHHIQVHHIQMDNIRHKSSLPHPCSMSPSAHRLSDECVQQLFQVHRDTITDSEDETYTVKSAEEIKKRYNICFVPSPTGGQATSENPPVPVKETDNMQPEVYEEQGNKQEDERVEKPQKGEMDHKAEKLSKEEKQLIFPQDAPVEEPEAYELLCSPPQSDLFTGAAPQNEQQLGPDTQPPEKEPEHPDTNIPEEQLDKPVEQAELIDVMPPEQQEETKELSADDNKSQSSDGFNINLMIPSDGRPPNEGDHAPPDQSHEVEGFRGARTGACTNHTSGSGQINNIAIKDYSFTDAGAGQVGGILDASVLSSQTLVNSKKSSFHDLLSAEVIDANNNILTKLPEAAQEYAQRNGLVALKLVPSEMIKEMTILPSSSKSTFVDCSGCIYRLYGSDFVQISTNGHVYVEKDEDSNSDYQLLKSTLLNSHSQSSLRHCEVGGSRIDLDFSAASLGNIQQDVQVTTDSPLKEKTPSNSSAPSNTQGNSRSGSETVLISYVTHPLTKVLVSKSLRADAAALHSDALSMGEHSDHTQLVVMKKHESIPEIELQTESVPVSVSTLALASTLTSEQWQGQDLALSTDVGVSVGYNRDMPPQANLENDGDDIAPIICVDNAEDTGDAFIGGEDIDESAYPPEHLIEAASQLPLHPNSVHTPKSQSRSRSAGISSADSKRSINLGLSFSSYASRPTSSYVEYEQGQPQDATELAVVITEAPGDPILAPIESPTTDRLVTAHGLRSTTVHDDSVTPDPSAVVIPEEQSRQSVSSSVMNLIPEVYAVPAFEVTPQIQLDNAQTSKFMDDFINSYFYSRRGTDDHSSSANVLPDVYPEPSIVTEKIRPSGSLAQKLNRYVLTATASERPQHEKPSATVVSEATVSKLLCSSQHRSDRRALSSAKQQNKRMTIREAHLAMPLHSTKPSVLHNQIKEMSAPNESLPQELQHLTKEQMQLYNRINDGKHLSDNSPRLHRKIKTTRLVFSVPMRSPCQNFMYTLKCLNLNSYKVPTDTKLFSVLRNNDSGFYIGVYMGRYLIMRIEICDISRIECELSQVFLHFRRAFIATGAKLPYAHFDLYDERRTQAFVKDLREAIELAKPLMLEREQRMQ